MRKYLSVIVMIAMTISLLCACSSSSGADDDSKNGTQANQSELVLTSTDWVEGIDFCQAEWWPDCASLTSDPLFIREADGTLSPGMATDYTVSEDGLTIRITLASDLKYHDGTSVVPEDVKRSIEWASEKSMYSADFAVIESIDVEGNDIILNLSSYSPSILFYMGHNFWPTIKASDIDNKTPDDLRWTATSYGPYYVDEYVSGSHVILKRNEYYKTYNTHVTNKGKEPVETIRVRFTTDSFAIVQGMLANEIDMSYDVTESNIEELKANSSIECNWTPTTAVFRMLLNPQDSIFADANVRKAFSLLIDREKMAEYSDGANKGAYALSISGMLDYSSEVEDYFKKEYCNDTEKGLQLLKKSGWEDTNNDGILDKDGNDFIVKIMYGDDAQKKIVELMQGLLKDDGIQVEGEMVDAGTYYESVTAGGNYQAALAIFAWGDTSTSLPYLIPDQSILDFDKFMEGCEQASTIRDDATRVQAFAKLQKEVLDTNCVLPIVSVNALFTCNSDKINHLYFDENGFIYLNDIE